MKRIAITGTHGVGKTTLSKLLTVSLDNRTVALNSNLARTLIKNGFPLGKDATDASYIQYIISQLQAEQAAKDCDVFISDRTLLDPLAYALVNQNFGNNVSNNIIELLKSVWFLEAQQYDLYVFVPIEFAVQPDGIRPKGNKYREDVERQIVHLLNANGINYLWVSGSLENRKIQVIEAIEHLFTNS